MRLGIPFFCVFSCFCTGAVAAVNLPVVNVTAGAVSARAMFGESIVPDNAPALVDVAPLPKVVARNAAKPAKPVAGPVEKVVKASPKKSRPTDILIPQRPTNNIWAKGEARSADNMIAANVNTDMPLRLPDASEFAYLDSEYELPEESLDSSARARDAAPVSGALDLEIKKLVELQRRADASVRPQKPAEVVARTAAPITPSSTIASFDAPKVAANLPAVRDVAPREIATAPQSGDDIVMRRMVVPMDDSVADSAMLARNIVKTGPVAPGADEDFSKLSPSQLKKAFQKTYVSENKHLSTYQIDDSFDVESDVSYSSSIVGFDSSRDLSESGGVRPLEIKIGFLDDDSALSRDNYNLLSEYASIVVSNPKRAIQVSIPERATKSLDSRKLAARRLAIVEQVLRDTGVAGRRIVPVLSQRSDDSFVLRVISNDQYETMVEKRRDIFGDTTGSKKYKSMSW